MTRFLNNARDEFVPEASATSFPQLVILARVYKCGESYKAAEIVIYKI